MHALGRIPRFPKGMERSLLEVSFLLSGFMLQVFNTNPHLVLLTLKISESLSRLHNGSARKVQGAMKMKSSPAVISLLGR
ncbi:unnamed protein product [Brassica oleracea]